MPDWLQALLLGALQGLTEFLPVSSSGHLVLLRSWFGEDFFAAGDEVLFFLVLHVGTLLPVLWFYRKDLGGILASARAAPSLQEAGGFVQWMREEPSRWLAVGVVAGSVPTAIIGVLLEDTFDSLFSSVTPVCIALALTGLLLFATRFVRADASSIRIGLGAAVLIGVVQGLAITPGISRSGSTIAIALFLGLERNSAARFSFLLSIPAICGAVLLKSRHGLDLQSIDWLPVAAGFFAALAVGYACLVLLVAIVRRGGLHRFAFYLLPASGLAWILLKPAGG